MLSVLVAALCAAVWGGGDFSGGKAAQKANPLAVTVLSQLIGLPVLLVYLVLLNAGPMQVALGTIGWPALAGVAGFVGILLLYAGLAQGAMSVFAPVSAVTAAVIPVLVGLATATRPSGLALAGVACAIVAVALVSMPGMGSRGGGRMRPRLIGLALASGAMFGVFFTILGRAGAGHGLWPLVGVRLGSLAVGLTALARTGTGLRLATTPLRWTVSAGVLDITANALYLVAATNGTLTVVAPVAALYPVTTVLLALAVDREQVRATQLAGLGLAATALVLVAT